MDDLSFDLADATAKTENDELNGNMIKPKKKQKRKSSGSASSSSPVLAAEERFMAKPSSAEDMFGA